MGLIYRPVRLMSIKLHGFLIRKRRKEVLCISRLNLPKEQPVRRERWKACKCCIDGHTTAPLLRTPFSLCFHLESMWDLVVYPRSVFPGHVRNGLSFLA